MRRLLIELLGGYVKRPETQFEKFVSQYAERLDIERCKISPNCVDWPFNEQCRLVGLLAEMSGYMSTELKRQREPAPKP